MEKITLTPLPNEIIVNHGAEVGAVDVFSYSADEAGSKDLGSLYVIGHRSDDSANMGYIVSLIAALARREYYAQHSLTPRDAFTRTLRKANEVVEEFFRAGEAKLSVGIVAVAGGQVMVSKLDKFKIFLARDGQVIDILSNVLLFSKEHTERRRFSSIIHGSVQAGDRILAFVPTRAVVARERNLKSWFLKLPQNEFAQRVSEIGQEHASFAAAMIHIDITQTSEPALTPSPQPRELTPPPPTSVPEPPTALTPSLVSEPATAHSSEPLAWSPRQYQATAVAHTAATPRPTTPAPTPADTEAPRLIPTEFALGTRRTALSRLFDRMRIVRLDTRGKAVALVALAVVTVGLVLGAKSFFLTDPQEEEARRALESLRTDVAEALAKNSQGSPVEARALLSRALTGAADLGLDDDVQAALSDEITNALDTVDRAESVAPTLLASPAPDAEHIALAVWSSPSQSLWVGGHTDGGTGWAAVLRDGVTVDRITLGTGGNPLLIGWKDSVIMLDPSTRILTRIVGSEAMSYTIPVQETILDAAEFGDSLYVLTDTTILKISDLDTAKPVTKRWLTDDTQLAAGAARLIIDGSIYLMSRDGTLTTYYKGAQTASASAPLTPSGVWRLMPWSDGNFAVAAGDARRIYVINPTSGSLIRTLKIDSLIPFTYVGPGPDGSALLVTEEGKLWQVK